MLCVVVNLTLKVRVERKNLAELVRTLRNITYHYEPISIVELDEFYARHYIDAYGPDLYPMDKYRLAIGKNPRIAFKVVEVARNSRTLNRLIGFFDIIPLERSGSEKIRRGKNRAHKLPLEPEDMAQSPEGCTEFYLGGRASLKRDTCSRAVVLHAFESEFNLQRNGRRVELYARPVSDDGVRLMTTYGFTKLDLSVTDSEAYWHRLVMPADPDFKARANNFQR